MKKYALGFLIVLMYACAPSQQAIQEAANKTLQAIPTWTSQPTFTSQPTYTPLPTYTSVPTKVIVVTAIFTETPLYTATNTPIPTDTPIPSNTPIPTNTPDPTTEDKDAGYYLVGSEIAPGVWRSENNGAEDCYWEITTAKGDIIDNNFGMSGGTMYIPGSAFQVVLEAECGIWHYLGQK